MARYSSTPSIWKIFVKKGEDMKDKVKAKCKEIMAKLKSNKVNGAVKVGLAIYLAFCVLVLVLGCVILAQSIGFMKAILMPWRRR